MIRRRLVPLLLCLSLLLAFVPASGGTSLSISLPETVRGFTPGTITLTAPFAGEAVLRLYDRLDNHWLTMRVPVDAGKNAVPWNGLGANLERLMAGPYHFTVSMAEEDGTEITASAQFNISGTTPALLYALPSSDTLYQDKSEKWFVECCLCAVPYLIRFEVRNEAGKTVYGRDITISNEDGMSIPWNGRLDSGKAVEPGDYTVSVWCKLNPEYSHTFPLHIAAKRSPLPEVAETGPVIPERGMSDEEIWEIMMRPSVVIRGNSTFKRFNVYSRPNSSSRAVTSGPFRCSVQAMEVLRVEDKWAFVRAWSHNDAQPVEGYIQVRNLEIFYPSKQYAVLIDKRDQTLTVWESGRPIGTVPVSTGLAVGRDTWRETPPGAFLTDVHIGPSFAQDGFRYEYPIRYDAGNMIHGLGYVRLGSVRDYSRNLPKLGQKDSHGCTRVSLFAGDDGFLNIYWLWTHLPYHTRVIVLDS